jgi:NAD(P)-dependent dehydrogenase (short-subunit alcohol dehydrogenase family)
MPRRAGRLRGRTAPRQRGAAAGRHRPRRAMRAAAAHIVAAHGRIDLAVYCAGTYTPCAPPPSTWTRAAPRAGELCRRAAPAGRRAAARCCSAGRRRARRHLSLVSSVAGYRGLPQALAYGPTKAALINLAETLYLDLHRWASGVSMVNPGFVETPLTAQNSFRMPALITPEEAARPDPARLARATSRSTSPSASRSGSRPAPPGLPALLRAPCGARRGCDRRPATCARVVDLFEPWRRGSAAAGRALHRRRALQGPVQRGAGRGGHRPHLRAHVPTLEAPRFVIHEVIVQGDQCFLTWDFVFRHEALRRDEQVVHGGSHLRWPPTAASCRAPRLLGRGRGAVREAAAAGRADALAEAPRQRPEGHVYRCPSVSENGLEQA